MIIPDIDKSLVEKLRNAFLQELSAKGTDVLDPKDVERVKKDDAWLWRFILHNESNQSMAAAMMWESLTWRKEFKTNEVVDLVKKDILVAGGFFPHGRDKDGCSIFIFKCKKYVKNAYDIEDLKRCVVYWFERLERLDKGMPISIFFDMEGCGLSNMDLEFTKYLIGLFKSYYPYFLNYILIFEMPWILNAAFKIIKSWLPEKAVEKIKFVGKKDIKEYVPLDQALTCWGGQSDYVFSFLPEPQEITASTPIPTNRKVHFADGSAASSSMSESPEGSGDRDHDGSGLSVQPSNIITFTKEGDELVSILELRNNDQSTFTFKLKTTSPEKFRVRPSVGILTPGEKTTVSVTLLPGFQLGGLSRDKFLVMSTVIEPNEMGQDLSALWKDTSGRKVHMHRMKCAQSVEHTKNGSAVAVSGGGQYNEQAPNNQLQVSIAKLTECQTQLHRAVRRMERVQYCTLFLVLVLGSAWSYILYKFVEEDSYHGFCKSATGAP